MPISIKVFWGRDAKGTINIMHPIRGIMRLEVLVVVGAIACGVRSSGAIATNEPMTPQGTRIEVLAIGEGEAANPRGAPQGRGASSNLAVPGRRIIDIASNESLIA